MIRFIKHFRDHMHLVALERLNAQAESRYKADPSLKNTAKYAKANNALYQQKHGRGHHSKLIK